MKIVKDRESFAREIRCNHCEALLLVEEEDVRVQNFAVAYAGETNEWEPCFTCVACGSTNIIRDFPYYLFKNLMDQRDV